MWCAVHSTASTPISIGVLWYAANLWERSRSINPPHSSSALRPEVIFEIDDSQSLESMSEPKKSWPEAANIPTLMLLPRQVSAIVFIAAANVPDELMSASKKRYVENLIVKMFSGTLDPCLIIFFTNSLVSFDALVPTLFSSESNFCNNFFRNGHRCRRDPVLCAGNTPAT